MCAYYKNTLFKEAHCSMSNHQSAFGQVKSPKNLGNKEGKGCLLKGAYYDITVHEDGHGDGKPSLGSEPMCMARLCAHGHLVLVSSWRRPQEGLKTIQVLQ